MKDFRRMVCAVFKMTCRKKEYNMLYIDLFAVCNKTSKCVATIIEYY